MKPLLRVERLVVSYGGAIAVNGVDIAAEAGSVVALLGANGAGKSSIARAISGMVRPASGAITFDESILRADPVLAVKAGIALVPEGRHIFPQLTVTENLLVGGFTRGRRRKARMRELQDRFPILRQRSKQLGGLLSGGEQQVLAVCRALMTDPRLIMIDEPSLGLSPRMIDEVADVIAGMRQIGLTVLLIEQNAQFALRLADYAYVLERGQVSREADAATIRESGYVRKAYLGS